MSSLTQRPIRIGRQLNAILLRTDRASDISQLNSLGETVKKVSEFLFVAQKVDVHKAGAALSKPTVIFGDRLAVAPVAPRDPPLVANALRERLLAALG